MNPDELSGTTIGELSGATTRQIQHWTDQNWLRGIKSSESNIRAAFMYGPAELDVAKMMVFLNRAGFTFEKAAGIARVLVEEPELEQYVLQGVMGSVTVKFRLAADEPEDNPFVRLSADSAAACLRVFEQFPLLKDGAVAQELRSVLDGH